jgi:predicted nucleic acid-binding protein
MTTTAADALFVDTNVLVYASVEESEGHQAALARLELLLSSGRELWVSRQVLREYLCVLTRQNYFQRPLPHASALAAVRAIAGRLCVADESEEVTTRLLELAASHNIGGRNVHDCNIVATMLVQGISSLLTDNRRNFSAFAELIRIEDLR